MVPGASATASATATHYVDASAAPTAGAGLQRLLRGGRGAEEQEAAALAAAVGLAAGGRELAAPLKGDTPEEEVWLDHCTDVSE